MSATGTSSIRLAVKDSAPAARSRQAGCGTTPGLSSTGGGTGRWDAVICPSFRCRRGAGDTGRLLAQGRIAVLPVGAVVDATDLNGRHFVLGAIGCPVGE